MWSRVELKTSAKQILQKNYWGAVLVGLILSICLGGAGVDSVFNVSDFMNKRAVNIQNDVISDGLGHDFTYHIHNSYNHIAGRVINFIDNISYTTMLMILILVFIILIAAVAISAFVLAPIEVGCRRWMLKNRTDNPQFGEIAFGFKDGYLNIVKIMFCRNLFITLWSLLFVIPGIVKAYEYRMIPYLLAENPNMEMSEAFGRTKNMMYNNKMDAFVLDLSFLGWYLLTAFTCGVLAIFYVTPYVYLTETELYVALCQTPKHNDATQGNGATGQYDSTREQYDEYREV
ncbi:MAG: DUF975 family protein [Eubacterium sp.]|nr:DUF975 family protein [Eubacterium sp.]